MWPVAADLFFIADPVDSLCPVYRAGRPGRPVIGSGGQVEGAKGPSGRRSSGRPGQPRHPLAGGLLAGAGSERIPTSPRRAAALVRSERYPYPGAVWRRLGGSLGVLALLGLSAGDPWGTMASGPRASLQSDYQTVSLGNPFPTAGS